MKSLSLFRQDVSQTTEQEPITGVVVKLESSTFTCTWPETPLRCLQLSWIFLLLVCVLYSVVWLSFAQITVKTKWLKFWLSYKIWFVSAFQGKYQWTDLITRFPDHLSLLFYMAFLFSFHWDTQTCFQQQCKIQGPKWKVPIKYNNEIDNNLKGRYDHIIAIFASRLWVTEKCAAVETAALVLAEWWQKSLMDTSHPHSRRGPARTPLCFLSSAESLMGLRGKRMLLTFHPLLVSVM